MCVRVCCVCVCVCAHMYVSVCECLCLSSPVRLSQSVCLPAYLSAYLPTCLPTFLPVCSPVSDNRQLVKDVVIEWGGVSYRLVIVSQ